MKTIYPVLIVLSFFVTASLFTATGFTTAWGAGGQGDDIVSENVEGTAPNESEVGISGSTETQDSGNVIGFIINGTSAIIDILLLGLFFKSALLFIGFPAWFANPLGNIVSIMLAVGVIQFATGRFLK